MQSDFVQCADKMFANVLHAWVSCSVHRMTRLDADLMPARRRHNSLPPDCARCRVALSSCACAAGSRLCPTLKPRAQVDRNLRPDRLPGNSRLVICPSELSGHVRVCVPTLLLIALPTHEAAVSVRSGADQDRLLAVLGARRARRLDDAQPDEHVAHVAASGPCGAAAAASALPLLLPRRLGRLIIALRALSDRLACIPSTGLFILTQATACF
eukprot:6173560-Pleurochrysis_carterae.AAC.2